MGVDLSVKFNKFQLQNPIMSASGTFGYSLEYDVFEDVKKLGAVVTKGITLEPRPGNEGERIFEVESGMINRIGLENVGIKNFLKTKKRVLEMDGINYVLNVAGHSFEDYFELAKICEENKIPALELNVSCPNVKTGCLEFGVDPVVLEKLVSGVRQNYNGFLIIKLTPNTSDIASLARASEKGGADCISAINTVKGLGVKVQYSCGKFQKSFVSGGLSGKCVKPVALYAVKTIKEAVKIPVIAIGGISKLSDLFEFMAVGADAFEIGTENFTTPDICERLINELTCFMINNGFETLDKLKEEIRK